LFVEGVACRIAAIVSTAAMRHKHWLRYEYLVLTFRQADVARIAELSQSKRFIFLKFNSHLNGNDLRLHDNDTTVNSRK
jgi:hypothetical protein